MRTAIWVMGWGLCACSMPNPLFGLATESEGDAAASTDEAPIETGLPTTDGPDASTGPAPGSTADSTASPTAPDTATGQLSAADSDAGPDLGVPSSCGDSVVGAGEECDDANDAPADGCEANCRFMFRRIEHEVGPAPRDIVASDLDLDGFPDLAVGHASFPGGDPELTVLSNDGGELLVASAFSDPGHPGVARVLVGSFVGGPEPDIVLVPVVGDTLRLFENTSVPGQISFAAGESFDGPEPGPDATVADLEGDGDDDLLLLSLGKLFVYENTGGAFVNSFSDWTVLTLPIGVAAGKVLPGSPSTHVAVVHAGLMANDLSGFVNLGDGELIDSMFSSEHCPTGAVALEVGDADGVGPQDLAIACLSGQINVVGTDVEPYQIALQGLPALKGAGFIDIYGDDGQADVYGLPVAAGALAVGVQQGQAFVASAEVDLIDVPGAAAVADLDQDGAPDLAVIYPGSGGIGVLLNQTRLPKP